MKRITSLILNDTLDDAKYDGEDKRLCRGYIFRIDSKQKEI